MMQLNKMKSTLRLGKQQLVLILVNIFGFSNCLYPSFLYCIVFSGTNDWLRNQCIINSRRAVVGIKPTWSQVYIQRHPLLPLRNHSQASIRPYLFNTCTSCLEAAWCANIFSLRLQNDRHLTLFYLVWIDMKG